MSTNKSSRYLWQEFLSAKGKDAWLEKVKQDFPEDDIKNIQWESDEGISIEPFYCDKDISEEERSKYHNLIPQDQENTDIRQWNNVELIQWSSAPLANKCALEALNTGADGIVFELYSSTSTDDIDQLMKGILPIYCQVSFRSDSPRFDLIEYYLDFLSAQKCDPQLIIGGYQFDVIRYYLEKGILEEKVFKDQANLLLKAGSFEDFKCLFLSNEIFKNNGGTITHSAAFLLNGLVDLIDRLGQHNVSPQQIFKCLHVGYATGTNFFLEIAQLRALRKLITQIADCYGVSIFPSEVNIHTAISTWYLSHLSAQNNLLRTTSITLSAILGGCNSHQYLPHDVFVGSSKFSLRIARNLSNIIKEEAYINKVTDVSAGSYFIDTMTEQLSIKTWESFQEIEKKGGCIASISANEIPAILKTDQQKQWKKLEQEKAILVGINRYTNTKEQYSQILPLTKEEIDRTASFHLMPPRQLSERFEYLRSLHQFHFSTKNEQIPVIQLVGNHKNKDVQFIRKRLECLGFKTAVNSFDGLNEKNEVGLYYLVTPQEDDEKKSFHHQIDSMSDHASQNQIVVIGKEPYAPPSEKIYFCHFAAGLITFLNPIHRHFGINCELKELTS